MISRRFSVSPEQLQLTLIVLLVGCHLAFLLLVAVRIAETGYNPRIDFAVFWGAARVALEGDALAAFDWPLLETAQGVAPGGPEYPWLYPPAFHLAVAPFGLLPFGAAFTAFTLGGLALYALALWAWTMDVPGMEARTAGARTAGARTEEDWTAGHLWLAASAPAVLMALMVGNTSLFVAAALLTALRCGHRPVLAGALLALMTIKPQLGLMIPLALVAAGAWRVMLWAGLWTGALVAATLGIFGAEYWAAFFRGMSALAADIAASTGSKGPMISWYALLRELGLAHGAALAAHGAALAGAGAAVALVWARGTGDITVAALCLASLLATPYALQYDLVLAAVAAMFLARAGMAGTRPGAALVALLWAGPLVSWVVPGLEPAHYAAPLLTLGLGACVARALELRTGPMAS